MPFRPQPASRSVQNALLAFVADGVHPVLAAAFRHDLDHSVAEHFERVTLEKEWLPLPAPPTSYSPLTLETCVTLLAASRFRTLAYGMQRGKPEQHVSVASDLVLSLEPEEMYSNSTLHCVIARDTLALPKQGFSYSNGVQISRATFEQIVLLVGVEHVALLVWTDED